MADNLLDYLPYKILCIKLRLFELFPKFLSATHKYSYFLHFGYFYFAKYRSFRIVFKVFSSKIVAVSASENYPSV